VSTGWPDPATVASAHGRIAMRIIRAETHHVALVWDLMTRCKRALEAQDSDQWDDVYPTREIVETDARRGTLYVLEDDDGHCVASVTLDETQAAEYASLAWTGEQPALVVHRLCVDPEAQGRGHAHRLMAFAESYAAERNYASMRLDAYTGNPRSVQLYRRRGYREVGQIRFPRRELPFWCFELIVDKTRRSV
jgi:ribosomal protein S18 acetylase RimI-like enzyme